MYSTSKQMANVEYFSYLGSLTTRDAGCTCGIKSRFYVAKSEFIMKLNLLSQQMGFKFKEEKKKREIKCYIWSIALYGVKLETLESRSEIP